MSEYEIIGQQVMRIQKLEKENDILISLVLALKKGELDIDRIELNETGFTVIDAEDEISLD